MGNDTTSYYYQSLRFPFRHWRQTIRAWGLVAAIWIANMLLVDATLSLDNPSIEGLSTAEVLALAGAWAVSAIITAAVAAAWIRFTLDPTTGPSVRFDGRALRLLLRGALATLLAIVVLLLISIPLVAISTILLMDSQIDEAEIHLVTELLSALVLSFIYARFSRSLVLAATGDRRRFLDSFAIEWRPTWVLFLLSAPIPIVNAILTRALPDTSSASIDLFLSPVWLLSLIAGVTVFGLVHRQTESGQNVSRK